MHRVELIINGAQWLNVSPLSGTVPIGGDVIINTYVDASGLFSGTYNSRILINTNDPQNPIDTIPYILNIDGSPVIAFSEINFDFDSVMQWRNSIDTLIIYNNSCDTLFISDIIISSTVSLVIKSITKTFLSCPIL